jgi:hypothetical protein
VATPAKKIHDLAVVRSDAKNDESETPSARRLALTPARRDEIIDAIAVEWRETFELLERFDRGEPLPDITSK